MFFTLDKVPSSGIFQYQWNCKTPLFDHSQRRCNHQDAQCILGRQIGYGTFARLCGTSEPRPPSCRNVKQREVADSWESQPSCLPVSAELIHVQLRSVLLIPSRQQPDFLCFLQHGEDFFGSAIGSTSSKPEDSTFFGFDCITRIFTSLICKAPSTNAWPRRYRRFGL